jgi:hypothetical protein
MSVFTPTRQTKEQSKVHYSEYITAEEEPKETDTAPGETPEDPEKPEAS